MAYDLIEGVPVTGLLHRLSRTRRRKYPFQDMEVGTLFLIPNRETNNMSAHASLVGKQLSCRFTTRLVYMRQDKKNAWKICDRDDLGASLGIGIWRTK